MEKDSIFQKIKKKNGKYTKFANAILKYGWENFEYIILETTTFKLADEREIFYIKKYDSFKNGYNLTTGGNSRKKVSNETKKKLSESQTNRMKSKMLRKKLSEQMKGKHISPATEFKKGIIPKIKRTKEDCKKIGQFLKQINKGKHQSLATEFTSEKTKGSNNPRAVKIRCIETNKVYNCIKDAADEIGTYRTTISNQINGRLKTAKGFHFEYFKEERKENVEVKSNYKNS